jgi:hypothetical protein
LQSSQSALTAKTLTTVAQPLQEEKLKIMMIKFATLLFALAALGVAIAVNPNGESPGGLRGGVKQGIIMESKKTRSLEMFATADDDLNPHPRGAVEDFDPSDNNKDRRLSANDADSESPCMPNDDDQCCYYYGC